MGKIPKKVSWRTLNRQAAAIEAEKGGWTANSRALRQEAAKLRRAERVTAKRKAARKTQTASIVAMRRGMKTNRPAPKITRGLKKAVKRNRRAAASASVETAQALNTALYGDTSVAMRALSNAEALMQRLVDSRPGGGGKLDFEHPAVLAAVAEIEKFGLDKAGHARNVAEHHARTLKRIELVSHFLAMVSAINLMNPDKGVANITVVADNEIEAIVKSLRLAGYSEHGYFPDGRQAMASEVRRAS